LLEIEIFRHGENLSSETAGDWRLEIEGWRLEIEGWRLDFWGNWKIEMAESWRLKIGFLGPDLFV
jgi:hypothetical protein